MSSDEELAARLRRTIEGDLAAARIIGAGGFSPQRWDTEPPGQVNPEDIPQSRAVTAALGCEPEYICGWVQLVAYDKLNNEPDERYGRDSEAPFAPVDNGRREFDHIIRHDPRSAVARCEAELAILGACLPDGSVEAALENGDISTGEYVTGAATDARIIRLLGYGYRFRPGYREDWAPRR